MRSIRFLEELRSAWKAPALPCVINGAIGPRGDGYKAGNMDADRGDGLSLALRSAAFAEGGADMVTAFTLNSINEAIGVVRAAKTQGIPVAISFTVETDGRLVREKPCARRSKRSTMRRTVPASISLINCAHPSHFEGALAAGEAWVQRIHGVRANASAKSHAELDESETLDSGDPIDLGRRYVALRRAFPSMRIARRLLRLPTTGMSRPSAFAKP